jgi:hypothetical protein
MRADMDRVVIERPRWGSGLRNQEVRAQRAAWRAAVARADFEGVATRVQMVPRRGMIKGLNDLLGPLKRFLRRRRGRPWDEVHAEVRHRLRADSLLQRHVLDHLERLVERRAWLAPDGSLWGHRYGFGPVRGMFVHPVTGRLDEAPPGRRSGGAARRMQKVRRRRPALRVYTSVSDRDRRWLQLASGWVVVRLADDDGHDALFDRAAAQVSPAERAAVYGDAGLRAVTCRPVGRRARRARGLG